MEAPGAASECSPEEVGLLPNGVVTSSSASRRATCARARRRWRWLLLGLGTVGLLALGLAALGTARGAAGGLGPTASTGTGQEVLLFGSGNSCPWKHVEGSLIPGFNIALYQFQTPRRCMQHCEEDEKCKSVEFATAREDPGNVFKPGVCILQSTAEGIQDYSNVVGYKNVDLYVKDCTGKLTEAPITSRSTSASMTITTSSSSTSASTTATSTTSSASPDGRLGHRHPASATTTPGSTTKPCKPKVKMESPSLFGFSVMTPGPEVSLLLSQFEKQAGIFACNQYAVISVQHISLGKDECGEDVWTWFNPSLRSVPMGTLDATHGVTTNSWLNTGTFINAWDMLMASPIIWKHAWIIKADPDAVILPDRVRAHVARYTGVPHYVLNCNFQGQLKIFGAVEVFSLPAIAAYHNKPWVCKKMGWQGWGEDSYMQNCMDALGVANVVDLDLVGDARCRYRACEDGAVAAFHPFKDVGAYWGCWGKAVSHR